MFLLSLPKIKKKIFFFTCFFTFAILVTSAEAINSSDFLDFNVDSSYDLSARNSIPAILVKTTPKLYFYFEKTWWVSQVYSKQAEILNNLENLSQEFNNRIYPILTSFFGSEFNPGVDGDPKITVFFHLMKEGVGGYFRSNDEYLKIQVPDSNEREMIYLSISLVDNNYKLKTFLAHELVHLITFNQKNKINNVEEEIWLNEARAEYSATLLGYNDNYNGSILEERIKDFLNSPNDSLTEWRETKADYGVVNLFTHYLVDHYGVKILSDSLKSNLIGISSINEALYKNGFQDDFSKIFTNWTIAILINNCELGEKYCYFNQNLKDIKIIPLLNFLPLSGQSSLSVSNVTKNWSGNWQKIIGGNGDLIVEFSSLKGLNFKIPYLVQTKEGNISLNFLPLDENQKGKFSISDFSSKNNALILIFSLQSKTSGFNGNEFTYPYTFIISISNERINNPQQNNPLIPLGFTFQKNLYLGIVSQDVVYLKILLSAEGCVSGLVNTAYFGPKTLAGVKCFQNKYKAEISAAAGYIINCTGFVGKGTRQYLNALLGW